jgi:hypothetical protein
MSVKYDDNKDGPPPGWKNDVNYLDYGNNNLNAQQIGPISSDPDLPPGSPHPLLMEYWGKIYESRKKLYNPRPLSLKEAIEKKEMGDELDALLRKPLPGFIDKDEKPRINWLGMFVLFAVIAILAVIAYIITDWEGPKNINVKLPNAYMSYAPSTSVSQESSIEDKSLAPESGIEVGAYGILEDGEIFLNARLPARPENVEDYRVTCYGPPQFPQSNYVARYPLTVADGLALAESMGLTGICAVSPDTPWYDDVTSDRLIVLHVEDHGEFLVLDRMASHKRNGIDLYNPYLSSTNQYCHWKEVWQVEEVNYE